MSARLPARRWREAGVRAAHCGWLVADELGSQYRDAILNYFHERLTSGVVEGLNNKLKLLKRRAFGYRNFAHFRLRVLVECDGGAGAH